MKPFGPLDYRSLLQPKQRQPKGTYELGLGHSHDGRFLSIDIERAYFGIIRTICFAGLNFVGCTTEMAADLVSLESCESISAIS